MSKKKNKNSNYKNLSTVNQAPEDKAKNRMIAIVCSVIAILLVGGVVAAMLLSSNKTNVMVRALASLLKPGIFRAEG
jgi:flagellar basal body-associated protein FliL